MKTVGGKYVDSRAFHFCMKFEDIIKNSGMEYKEYKDFPVESGEDHYYRMHEYEARKNGFTGHFERHGKDKPIDYELKRWPKMTGPDRENIKRLELENKILKKLLSESIKL